MKKSWNMKNWPKVIELCYQSWKFTKCTKFMFFATAKKLSIDVESLQFLTFSAKGHESKISKGDGHHGKMTNGHEKVMGKYLGTLAMHV